MAVERLVEQLKQGLDAPVLADFPQDRCLGLHDAPQVRVCTRTLHTSPRYTLPLMDNATVTALDAPVEEQPELVTEELLVEEISIDGMCGVY